MKKLVCTVLALVLVLSLSVTAFAAEIKPGEGNNPNPDSTDTTVSLDVAPTYTVTIPSTVTLSKDESTGTYKQDATITAAAGVRLEQGKAIKVKLVSDFKLLSGSTEWPYTVKVGTDTTAISTNAVVATFETKAEEQSVTLHFEAGTPTFAGNYSDTVTFNISVENK